MIGAQILVVEDDIDVRETLETLLRAMGYGVVSTADGAKALAALRDGLRPRVILLDLMMPNMDGRRFRDLLAEDPALAGIPTIVVTVDPTITAASLGVTACLRKPFDCDELLREIKRHC